MAEGYTVRVNRRDGLVEVSGAEKEWVDGKLKELGFVYEQAIDEPTKPTRRARKASNGSKAPTLGKPARRKGKPASHTRSRRNPELAERLTPEIRKKLETFVAARKAAFDASQPAQAAILATFLMEELRIESIDHDDLYTLYSVMGWPQPANLRAALVNAWQRNNYFSGFSDGKTQLTNAGENYGKHESVSKK